MSFRCLRFPRPANKVLSVLVVEKMLRLHAAKSSMADRTLWRAFDLALTHLADRSGKFRRMPVREVRAEVSAALRKSFPTERFSFRLQAYQPITLTTSVGRGDLRLFVLMIEPYAAICSFETVGGVETLAVWRLWGPPNQTLDHMPDLRRQIFKATAPKAVQDDAAALFDASE